MVYRLICLEQSTSLIYLWMRVIPAVKRTTRAVMSANENMTDRTPMMKNRIPAMEKKSHGTNKKRFSAATAERELRSINMCDFVT
jgi:hypothetical protein